MKKPRSNMATIVRGRTRPLALRIWEITDSGERPRDLTSDTVTLYVIRLHIGHGSYSEWEMVELSRFRSQVVIEGATVTPRADQTAGSEDRGVVDWDPVDDGLGNDDGSFAELRPGMYLVQAKVVDGTGDQDYTQTERQTSLLLVTESLESAAD